MPQSSRSPFLLLAICCLIAAATVAVAHPRSRQEAPIVVYLVRHAEPAPPPHAEDPPDPQLNEAGRARAMALADLLDGESLDHVFSSEYRRTLETAGPLAARSGLQVEAYDPRALAVFAARLAGMPGRHVVVGHSNTTPELVGHLGGEPGEPIDEEREFDRLYVLVLSPGGGPVTTLRLRYGAPATP